MRALFLDHFVRRRRVGEVAVAGVPARAARGSRVILVGRAPAGSLGARVIVDPRGARATALVARSLPSAAPPCGPAGVSESIRYARVLPILALSRERASSSRLRPPFFSIRAWGCGWLSCWLVCLDCPGVTRVLGAVFGIEMGWFICHVFEFLVRAAGTYPRGGRRGRKSRDQQISYDKNVL